MIEARDNWMLPEAFQGLGLPMNILLKTRDESIPRVIRKTNQQRLLNRPSAAALDPLGQPKRGRGRPPTNLKRQRSDMEKEDGEDKVDGNGKHKSMVSDEERMVLVRQLEFMK